MKMVNIRPLNMLIKLQLILANLNFTQSFWIYLLTSYHVLGNTTTMGRKKREIVSAICFICPNVNQYINSENLKVLIFLDKNSSQNIHLESTTRN